jgi:hypothetical protein
VEEHLMLTRFRAFSLVLVLLFSLAAAPLAASAQTATGVTVPVTGTTNTGGAFSGAYTIQRFVGRGNNGLTAVGTLSGTVTDAAGAKVGTVTNQPVQIPVIAATGSCSILDLTLGPLSLNLLGLMVNLNQVHLTISAQSAPGNLLGNLLCAVANLLNGGAPLGALSGLLNRILAIL